jgi:serpin B
MPHVSDITRSHNEFSLRLYAELSRRPGNVFFSPFSVRIAFAMLHAGANGETAAQIGEVLGFSESIHTTLPEIIQSLNSTGSGNYELAVANSIWAQQGSALRADFLDLIAQSYDGECASVDFINAAEATRHRINAWVEGKTQEKIKDLLSLGDLNALTRLVLVNAVYFKGNWASPFMKEITFDQPFFTDHGQVTVPLMSQSESFPYAEGNGFQAVDLSYRGDDISMLILLPDRKDGLSELEKNLSVKSLQDCIARMTVTKVNVLVPRFKVVWGSAELSGDLKSLGMTLPFGPQADFSGINGCCPPDPKALMVSMVLHKAFVEINEEGTEAAAATALTMYAAMPFFDGPPRPIPVFRADHPFLFAIRDRRSGMILFLGRLADPS